MPSDSRALRAAALLAIAVSAGCREAPAASDALPERFAGVRAQAGAKTAAQSTFCEKTYPAAGPEARRYEAPPGRPLPGAEPSGGAGGASARGATWRWVNLWATWCAPCVDEMELLRRWRDGFSRDGMQVSFEFVSIDATDREQELAGWRSKGLPGPIRWLRSEGDLGPFLDSLGVDRSAMIPIHALVDASGRLRCVRVGAIHEQDYAAVKGLLASE